MASFKRSLMVFLIQGPGSRYAVAAPAHNAGSRRRVRHAASISGEDGDLSHPRRASRRSGYRVLREVKKRLELYRIEHRGRGSPSTETMGRRWRPTNARCIDTGRAGRLHHIERAGPGNGKHQEGIEVSES